MDVQLKQQVQLRCRRKTSAANPTSGWTRELPQ